MIFESVVDGEKNYGTHRVARALGSLGEVVGGVIASRLKLWSLYVVADVPLRSATIVP